MSEEGLYAGIANRMGLWYGFFVIAAGATGYYKKGSVISLVSGIICGIAAIIGSRLSGSDNYKKAGLIVLAVTGSVLLAIFSKRILTTGEFMPGGFLFLNSGGMLIVAVLAMKELAKVAVQVGSEKKVSSVKPTSKKNK